MEKNNEKALKAKKKEELINIIVRKDNVEAKLMKEVNDWKTDFHNSEVKYNLLQDSAKDTEEELYKYYAKVRKWRIGAIIGWCAALAAGIVYAILAA